MKNIRKGKTILLAMTVKTNGNNVSLEDRDITLVMHCPNGKDVTLSPTITGNVLGFTLEGKDMTLVGTYTLTVWENKGNSNQTVVDSDAFTIVSKSQLESGADSDNLTSESVALTTDLSIILPNYETLTNKPLIGGITLVGDKTLGELGILPAGSYLETLISGTNIKTINGNSILGKGNLCIEGGGEGTALVAGDGIKIEDGVISTTLVAGDGISISDDTISSTITKDSLGLTTAYIHKGNKASYDEVKALDGSTVNIGDVWNTTDTGMNYVCTDKASEKVYLAGFSVYIEGNMEAENKKLSTGDTVSVSIGGPLGVTNYEFIAVVKDKLAFLYRLEDSTTKILCSPSESGGLMLYYTIDSSTAPDECTVDNLPSGYVTYDSSTSGNEPMIVTKYTITWDALGLNDAPDATKLYARKKGSWVEVSSDTTTVDTTNSLIMVKSGTDTYVVAAQKLVKPNTPSISAGGSDTSASRTVTISCTTSGVSIYYTVDGTTPSASSKKYSAAFTVSASSGSVETTTTIKAIAIKNGQSSDVASSNIVTSRQVAQPTITASGNDYSTSRTITLACSTTGTTLYYTTDGTTPTTASTQYTAAFSISATTTIKVLAVLANWLSNSKSSDITVGTLKMYRGLVTTEPATVDDITELEAVEQSALPLTYAITTSGQYKVCVAYNSALSDLTSIKDGNGTEYLTDFNGPTTIGSYKMYCMKNAGDQKDITYTFK